MYKNIKWLRLVPDKPGKGGQKTGFHTFQPDPVNDIRIVDGWHIYRGRWQRDRKSELVTGTTNESGYKPVRALHGYVYPSLTDPSAQPSLTILGHHLNGAGGANRYWDFTNGAVRYTHAGGSVPATFLNISGRCFAADGAREGMVMDDRTPAIHAQRNQNLGIGTPPQPMPNSSIATDFFFTGSVALSQNVAPIGTGYVHEDSPYINHPNPKNRLGTILATDTVTPHLLDPGAGSLYLGTPMTAGNPTVDAVSSDVTPFTATGTITITTGTSKVTLDAGTTWPVKFQYVGLTINFAGYSFVILDHGVQTIADAVDINGDNGAGSQVPAGLNHHELLILGVYDGPTIAAPGVPYTITGCQVTMGSDASIVAGSTAEGAVPPGVAFGYSQSTAAYLVQIGVTATRDGTGYFRNLGNISMSEPNPDPTGNSGVKYITDLSMMDGQATMVTAVDGTWSATDVGLPIYIDKASSTGGILATTIKTFFSDKIIVADAANESGANIVTGKAWWGASPNISDGAMAAGADEHTLTSASNPFVPGDVGQTIIVEFGGTGATEALITTITTYNSAGSVELADHHVDAGAISGARVWWRGVTTNAFAGPTYAYAWYDPETGHMSNIAPMYQIPKPLAPSNYADFANITPFFQIDPGYIAYPTGVDALRFSHIMFFRTLSTPGSSTLYPIGSLQPFVGKVHPGAASTRGSWNPATFRGWMGLPNNWTAAPPLNTYTPPTYWYDFSSDDDLLLSGGFRAPQYTNEKPMVLLRGGVTQPGYAAHQAYWDRRLWVVCTQEPDKIMFSCDEAQCPLGMPVESFPPQNYLRIPSVDGRVLGMKTVGEMLLITTERWAYTIAGNNESNYRLLRVSTKMGGVGTYQMSEITSDVEGQASIVYFISPDKIVYEWIVGGAVNPISDPVQDILNTALTGTVGTTARTRYQSLRLHCVSAWSRRLLIVSFGPNNAYTDTDIYTDVDDGISDFLTFDIQNRVWTKNHVDDETNALWNPSAMTTVYGLDPPVNELWSGPNYLQNTGTKVRSWLREDSQIQRVSPTNLIATFPLNFDGLKTRKQIVSVNVHCATQWDNGWNCLVNVNEGPTITAVLRPFNDPLGTYAYDPLESVYSPLAGSATLDSKYAEDLVVMTAAFNVDNSALVGYRFTFGITTQSPSVGTTVPTEVYAIDIGYIDWQEPGEGDP